ncbi:hypothetical protein [Mycobacteroides abscessus]|nr:hypothetical protein [Mycobacteroides abscessus]MDO3017402.1 hypothetical protein [Mycobacteroides abscessus subsp. abscessus]MDO3083406.1 hypothetical protein [Mycobacteroides abscessus subsp. abscessus]
MRRVKNICMETHRKGTEYVSLGQPDACETFDELGRHCWFAD